MKSCVSLALGGEIIFATECTSYEDYDIYKLKCPICNEPVYYKAASIRHRYYGETEKKEINVSASFNHFPSSKITVEECELRVKCFSKKEIEKRKSVARNQRLKTYQKHFWNIIIGTYEYDLNKEIKECKKEAPLELHLLLPVYLSQFKENKEELYRVAEYIVPRLLSKKPSNTLTQEELDRLEEYKNSLNFKMQIKIICEVIDFLSAKSSVNLLTDMYYIMLIQSTVLADLVSKPFNRGKEGVMLWLLSNTIAFLAGIPWAQVLSNCITHNKPVVKSLHRPLIHMQITPNVKTLADLYS